MEIEIFFFYLALGTCAISVVGTFINLIYKNIEKFIYGDSGGNKKRLNQHNEPLFLRQLNSFSKIALHLTTVLVSMLFFLLLYYFISSNMEIEYVLRNSIEDEIWYYKIIGLWAGEEGSLFLWLWFVSLLISSEEYLQFRLFKRKGGKRGFFSFSEERHYLVTKLVMLLFLLGYIWLMIRVNPFERVPENLRPEVKQGLGLSFSLKTQMMFFHPPVEFLAYAMALFPFASSLSYLLTAEKEVYHTTYLWARLCWLFFTAAICFGAVWAYTALGWGGYWSWDPVEVGNLIPWLVLTVFLHLMVSFQRKGEYTSLLPFLGILTFATTLLATVVTRSGFWTSVHAFTLGERASLSERFIICLEESSSSRYFFKVMLASLIFGEMLFSMRIFYTTFPEFKKKLRRKEGARALLKKEFEKKRLEKESANFFDFLSFVFKAIGIFKRAYITTLRKFVREKGYWTSFPLFFSYFLFLLFLFSIVHIIYFMEFAFFSSNIALSVETGIAVLVFLLLLLPLSWKIMMEEEGEIEFSLRPSQGTFMRLTVALLFFIILFSLILLLKSINTTYASTFESRFPFIVLPLLVLLVFCTSYRLFSLRSLLLATLILFFLSLLLSVIFVNSFLLYLPLLLFAGAVAFVEAAGIREIDIKKGTPLLQIAGILQMVGGIVAFIFWGSDFSELPFIKIENNIAFTLTGFFGSFFIFAGGCFLSVYGKKRGKLSQLLFSSPHKIKKLFPLFTSLLSLFLLLPFLPGFILAVVSVFFLLFELVRGRNDKKESEIYVNNVMKRGKNLIFRAGAHFIHLGLVLVLIGYVMTQNYETSEEFKNVSVGEEWIFEDYRFEIKEISTEKGSSRWYVDAVDKIDIKIDIFNEQSERMGSILVALQWDMFWESNLSKFIGAYKQHVKVTRIFEKDFYFILHDFSVKDEKGKESTVPLGEHLEQPLKELNITSLSFELKLIRGTMFLWSGSGLMSAGIGMRVFTAEEKSWKKGAKS